MGGVREGRKGGGGRVHFTYWTKNSYVRVNCSVVSFPHSAFQSRRPEYATAITVRPLCPAALALLCHTYTDTHTHCAAVIREMDFPSLKLAGQYETERVQEWSN